MPGDGQKPPPKPKPNPNVGATSTPKPPPAGAEGGTTPTEEKPTVNDFNKLTEVARRLRVENEDALAEIDRLVAEVRDLKEEKLDNEERELDLSVLEMGDSKNTKVPPFTGTEKDEYSADIWLTNVERLAELNNWKDEQTLSGCEIGCCVFVDLGFV